MTRQHEQLIKIKFLKKYIKNNFILRQYYLSLSQLVKSFTLIMLQLSDACYLFYINIHIYIRLYLSASYLNVS